MSEELGEQGCAESDAVANTNSGRIQAAVFTLDHARFGNRVDGLTDSRIYNGDVEDITVRLLRVVKRGPAK